METEDIKKLALSTDGDIFFDQSIKNLNWFNIGGKTKIFFKPQTLQDLIAFLKLYNKRGKIFLLGAGSNTLFSDNVFEGVTIKLGKNFNRISTLDKNKLVAGSSVLDKSLSEFSMENSISGFEFLSCIPGSVGGGIRMNSGCYNREFKDILLSVQAVDFLGNILQIPYEEIKFSYRSTDLPKDLIYLSATFQGQNGDKENIQNEMSRLKQIKNDSQPSKIKTGGSTFKNPVTSTEKKVWELIRESVPEDISFGDAKISSKHSNFFVNSKNATFSEMNKLINFVRDEVKKKTGISLDLEIEIIE